MVSPPDSPLPGPHFVPVSPLDRRLTVQEQTAILGRPPFSGSWYDYQAMMGGGAVSGGGNAWSHLLEESG